MACCSRDLCDEVPENILWEFDYQTYCNTHNTQNAEKPTYNLKVVPVNLLIDLIASKYSKICWSLSSIFQKSLEDLKLQEKIIKETISLYESLESKYKETFQKILDSTFTQIKDSIDLTIYNLEYIYLNLPKNPLTSAEYLTEEIEKFTKISEKILKSREEFLPKMTSSISIRGEIEENKDILISVNESKYKNSTIIYINEKTDYQIEFWRIDIGNNKEYYLKTLRSTEEKSRKILLDEIEVIKLYKENAVFAPIISVYQDKESVKCSKKVYDVTLDKLLNKRVFTEDEVWKFVRLICNFINCVSGRLANYILEPSCVSFTNGEFLIQDIYYRSQNSNEKYQSPESKLQKTNSSPGVIFSAGVIIIEMLKLPILGPFNEKNYSVVCHFMQSQNISDKLKALILHMIHFNSAERVNKGNLSGFLNSQ